MTTMTTIKQQEINALFQAFKITYGLIVEACSDGLFLSGGDAAMLVGDYEGERRTLSVNDSKSVVKYIRTAKKGADISFALDGDNLVLDCERIGESQFGCKPSPVSAKTPIEWLGKHQYVISSEDVKRLAPYLNRCCKESTRYAIRCVYFDNEHVVATDGKRLVRLDMISPIEGAAMIESSVVALAAKFDEEILYNEGRVVVGDCIINHTEGRYPVWQKIIQDCDVSTVLDVDTLRIECDKAIKKAKVEENNEPNVEINLLPDVKCNFDPQFMLDAIGKMDSVNVSWVSKDVKLKWLEGPITLTSDEKPEWLEVIMPMKK